MAFQLTSPAFQHGGDIPKKFTCEADNVSPPLQWTGVPAGTKSFALVMEERDGGKEPIVHWILYQIPADAKELPEDIPHGSNLPDGLLQGQNKSDGLGYSGPCPKPGPAHRYYFKLYALNTKLNLQAGVRKEILAQAMKDQILASAELMGKFKWTGIQQKGGIASKKGKVTQPGASPAGPAQTSKARMRALENDPEYILQMNKVHRVLEKAYATDSRTVERFFRRHGFTSAFAMKKVREFMRDIENETVRRALEDYVNFANQFRVQLRLKTDPKTKELEFRVMPWQSYGTRFHVKYVGAGWVRGKYKGEHLEPAKGSVPPMDPYVDWFGDETLRVPEAIEELINEGKAKFVQIEDAAGYSILKDVESFAYKEDGVTIIQHNAEHPYFLCIFGEKTPKDLLPRIGKALSEFQRTHFGRGRGGRPPNIEELKKALALDRKQTPKIGVELAESADEKKIKVKEAKVSKLRRKVKDKYS